MNLDDNIMLKVQIFTIGPLQTNCYLACDDETKETILIDPAVFDKKIVDCIKGHNLNVKFTVNTHGHFDHVGANKEFGYPVLIHGKDQGSLKAHRLLKDQDRVEIKNIVFKIIHTPGHTPGSISIECDNVLFTGDTLFFGGVGRTDIPFASQSDLEKSIKRLMQYSDNTKIYPGHGPESTIGHEREYNPYA
ncbi:MAG: MBL fold metallo-hydrolase [Candidatus Omnitrophica bacterium]|nr:MBL fold metallo-hydrolase [Candidatus Omnitrophota bacterium]